MFTIHATKKLLDRVKAPVVDPVAQPSTALCNWYATAIFWKPQVALFVNEITFLPVFMPLAPSSTLAQRFPEVLREVLMGIEIDFEFIDHEILSMGCQIEVWPLAIRGEERTCLGRVSVRMT